MITLINGYIQDASGNPIVPNGRLEMYLSQDAQVIASPYGQVLGGTTNYVRFFFDSNGVLVQPVTIWSNAELSPQTYYIANIYDMNGTRLNNQPMEWIFDQASGSTVDISSMVNMASTGLIPGGGYTGTFGCTLPDGRTLLWGVRQE